MLTELRKHFMMSSVSQESNRNLASSWQCKAAHKFEDSGSHHKILLHGVNPSTLQALIWHHQISTCLEPWRMQSMIWSLRLMVMCDSHSKNLATWAGQGMILTRHTHTCSFLAQGCRSGQRLCGNIGYGVRPSLFIMCNFHDLRWGSYCEKK